jgi:antitoxin ParD1/3/4
MIINLTPDQEAVLSALVAAGDFASIEEAAQALLAERLAELQFEDDDMEWAKPFLDEAEADVARGDTITLEEHRERNAARLAPHRD